MDFYFEFNHSSMSMVLLHKNGIRSVKEIEEVIQGDSFVEEITPEVYGRSIFVATGFTNKSKPLRIAFSIDVEARIHT